MIERIVRLSLRKPILILLLISAIVVAGLAAFRALNIEAYPDPVPPLVEVIAQPQGHCLIARHRRTDSKAAGNRGDRRLPDARHTDPNPATASARPGTRLDGSPASNR